MRIFIDSADLKEIKEAVAWGIIDGVTTNPTLMAKSGYDIKTTAHKICELVDGPISVECVEAEAAGLLEEGRAIAQLHRNIVVKVPLTAEGLKAVKVFAAEGIKTNVTLCFNAAQGLLAAKAGATYISPFVGRLDDLAQPGMDVVHELAQIYSHFKLPTQILAASIRGPRHVVDAALAGAHVATLPFKVLGMLVKHPLTDSGVATFLADFAKIPRGA